jgi:biotin carboxyl carrier protein
MKAIVQIGEHQQEVEIIGDGTKITARVGGREYALETSEPEPHVFLLKHKGRVHEAFLSPRVDDRPYSVRIGSTVTEASIIDSKRLRGSAGGHESVPGRAEIKTAMPGKVVRILVAEGDAVAAGEGVIVVEAMKMQNEMKAPKDGTINKIRVTEGDNVGAGDVLVLID